MPTFFKAPKTNADEDIYESGIGDTRGYYEDDAYVARPSMGPTLPETAKTIVDPQEAFTIALNDRFLKQRDRLHLSPSPDAISALDDEHPISFPKSSNKAYADWHRILRNTAPQTSQVQSMEQDTVFHLLWFIQKRFLKREKEICAITSAWIWTLLARLNDVGTMDNDQVYAVRNFGKRAILVQLSFENPDAAQQLEHAATDEDDVHVGAEKSTPTDESATPLGEDIQASKVEGSPSVAASTSASKDINSDANINATSANTLATLDAIILLVGEVFGQRDLLEFRRPWNSNTEQNDES